MSKTVHRGDAALPATSAERRRRGRVDYRNPDLVTLLRTDGSVDPDRIHDECSDDLSSAKGIIAGAILGGLLWAGLFILLWWLL